MTSAAKAHPNTIFFLLALFIRWTYDLRDLR